MRAIPHDRFGGQVYVAGQKVTFLKTSKEDDDEDGRQGIRCMTGLQRKGALLLEPVIIYIASNIKRKCTLQRDYSINDL